MLPHVSSETHHPSAPARGVASEAAVPRQAARHPSSRKPRRGRRGENLRFLMMPQMSLVL